MWPSIAVMVIEGVKNVMFPPFKMYHQEAIVSVAVAAREIEVTEYVAFSGDETVMPGRTVSGRTVKADEVLGDPSSHPSDGVTTTCQVSWGSVSADDMISG